MKQTLVLSIAAAGLLVQSGTAATLYTTADDFAQFHGTPVTSASFFSDSSTVNGAGNTSTPGGAGSAGSLQLTLTGGWGNVPGGEFSFSSGSSAAVQAIAPGSTGTSIGAASGTISFDVYAPTFTSWWGIGLSVSYKDHNWWEGANQFFSWQAGGSSSSFVGADGNTWTRHTIPYTISAATEGWFYMSLFSNSDGVNTGKTFYIDNIEVQASPVPEPNTMAFAAMGVAAFLLRNRRAVR